MVCVDAHAYDQLCKQCCKAPGLTFKLTNHKLDYYDKSDYGILLDSDVVEATTISSNSDIYGFKSSAVSTFFDL